jgi:hypothetical protein
MKAKSQKKTKPVKQNTAAETSAKCPSCPHPINFFSHFDPDEIAAKQNFENGVLVFGFLTGTNKIFPLHLPFLEKAKEDAFAGNQAAAKFLVELATHLSWWISALEKQQPEIMSEIARKINVWPVVADTQPGSNVEMLARLDELGLGKDIPPQIEPSFRKARGCDENHPARHWAKAAVRCVNTTRFWQRQLVSRKDSVDKKFEQGTWKRGIEPAWVSEVKNLPDYSNQSRAKWADVIRTMIREELPEFHLQTEWANQRNSCKKRNRGSKGEIQNTIFDDIISALKTITPGEINQSAENSMPNFSTQLKG